MKILMVVGRSTGGIGSHVDGLVTQLRRAGAEVAVVTDSSTARAFGWDDARTWWPVRHPARVVTALADWHRIMRLASTVDVVHAHGHQAAVVAAAAVVRARPRPRFVVSLHNDLPPVRDGAALSARARGRAARAVIAAALRQAGLVTGASGDLVALARELGARRAELAPVTAPGVARLLAAEPSDDTSRAAARARLLDGLEADADRSLVLTVSRIAPQKDLGTLVRAARASGSDATWVVVGGGDEALRADLENELSGIRLHLVGPRRDVVDWFRVADVFVLTSRWEARALVVQEAMAAGVPVVATATGGLPELVGNAGVLVPVGDSGAVAEAVDSLLADTEERRRLARLGRSVAATWDSVTEEARRWMARYTETPSG